MGFLSKFFGGGEEKDYIGDLKGHPVRVQVKYDGKGNVIEGKITTLPPEVRARIEGEDE